MASSPYRGRLAALLLCLWSVLLAAAAPAASSATKGDKYLLGVGKGDITGPVVEINFAGYASLPQKGTGLRQRLYARSFIIGDVSNPNDRILYVVLDTQSGDTALRFGVLDGLAALGDEYASLYGDNNLALTGTHSHSGPGAWFNYLLPQITSLGFDKQSYQAVVDGTLLSIKRAHESLTEGYLDYGTVDIPDGNINRSPFAYEANPEEERARYEYDTDKEMTLLRFQRASDDKYMGFLSWFPVHGTSMLENNTHVTGDNKGVAAWLFERDALDDESAVGDGAFVAGFSQANVGDTTPNTLGAWCDDGSGEKCSYERSLCNGKSQQCHGRGPLFYELDLGVSSCFEIGRRQYEGAMSIWNGISKPFTPVTNPSVRAFHTFHPMAFSSFTLPNGTEVQTCPAALGHSFAAGTTDGPGAFDFTQGDSAPANNPFWNVVRDILTAPTPEQVACQHPKPVLLDVGQMHEPYEWDPNIVDIQALRVGQFVMVISPSEATTMSGRRWREAVAEAVASDADGFGLASGTDPKVVLGGPANTYAHYVATPEEYSIQRYEGASTLYGQWELNAYINLTLSNLHLLQPESTASSSESGLAQPLEKGTPPPDNREASLSFITGVVKDDTPSNVSFGDCIQQPRADTFARGATINATFQGANPRNNLRLEGTFLAVEKKGTAGSSDEWTQVLSDADWHLVYTWERTDFLLGFSEVTATWETGKGGRNEGPGTYRFRYYGDYKPFAGKVEAFEGVSDEFELT